MTEQATPTTTAGIDRLHSAIARGKERGGIALVSHAVVGYPALSDNRPTIARLCAAGADVMELQFPFSDPMADGPILTAANQDAVRRGISVDDGMAVARDVCAAHPDVAFIVMTYFNVIYKRGIENFVRELAEAGVAGIIVPDLPIEESGPYRELCATYGLGTVFLVTPMTTRERMAEIAGLTTGFVYCIGRAGVSGAATTFGGDMTAFVDYVTSVATVPVGVGFGVRTAQDVAALKPMADMAMVCTEIIRRIDADGVDSAADYLAALRS